MFAEHLEGNGEHCWWCENCCEWREEEPVAVRLIEMSGYNHVDGDGLYEVGDLKILKTRPGWKFPQCGCVYDAEGKPTEIELRSWRCIRCGKEYGYDFLDQKTNYEYADADYGSSEEAQRAANSCCM